MDPCLGRSGQWLYTALGDLSQIFGSKQVSMGKNTDLLEKNQLSSRKHKAPQCPLGVTCPFPIRQPFCHRGLDSHAGLGWAVKAVLEKGWGGGVYKGAEEGEGKGVEEQRLVLRKETG